MLTKIALAQLFVEPGKVESNYFRGLKMIHEAAESGSHFILFPELWTSGYPIESHNKVSLQNAELITQLSQIALEENIIIGGSFLLHEEGRFYNRYLLLTPETSKLPHYDKIHLFRPLNEDKLLSKGNTIAFCSIHSINLGLSICYDLRFPEMFRAYAANHVDLIVLAAEWPLSRIKQWKILIQARAIENQTFFAAVNCIGKTRIETFGGSSQLVDPFGNFLLSASESDECLLTAECDLNKASLYRDEFPVLQSQREDLFDIHQRVNKIPTES